MMLSKKDINDIRTHTINIFSNPKVKHDKGQIAIKTYFKYKNHEDINVTKTGYTRLDEKYKSKWEYMLTSRIHHYYYDTGELHNNINCSSKYSHAWEDTDIIEMSFILYWFEPVCLVHKSKKITIINMDKNSIIAAINALYSEYISRQTIGASINRVISSNIIQITILSCLLVLGGGAAVALYATNKVICYANSYFPS
jgi:hypothetical protein